jgi:molybdenum cofactor biosynthesis enzyme MoaA
MKISDKHYCSICSRARLSEDFYEINCLYKKRDPDFKETPWNTHILLCIDCLNNINEQYEIWIKKMTDEKLNSETKKHIQGWEAIKALSEGKKVKVKAWDYTGVIEKDDDIEINLQSFFTDEQSFFTSEWEIVE